MTLCRWNRHMALVFILGMTTIAALGSGAALAGPPAGVDASLQGDGTVPDEGGAPLILADASGTVQGNRWSPWSPSIVAEMVRPPGEKDGATVATGLTSATIIRPLKDKQFALAFVVGTPTTSQSHTIGARPSVFKQAYSNIAAPYRSETIKWVVLVDMVLTGRGGSVREFMNIENTEGRHDETSWHYSVEMVFVPLASLAVRAALSVDPEEEVFDTGELTQVLERSRIGVSIGLDFRPKDGVSLDIDYAKVMNARDAFQSPWVAPASDPESYQGSSAGEDVISASLSIQF